MWPFTRRNINAPIGPSAAQRFAEATAELRRLDSELAEIDGEIAAFRRKHFVFRDGAPYSDARHAELEPAALALLKQRDAIMAKRNRALSVWAFWKKSIRTG